MNDINKYLALRICKLEKADTIIKSIVLSKILNSQLDTDELYTIVSTKNELEEIDALSKIEIPVNGSATLKDNLLRYYVDEKSDEGCVVKIKFSDYL